MFSKLDSHLFETWHCPQPCSIGVNFSSLHRAIRASNERDIFSLFVENGAPDKLLVKIQNSMDLESVYTIQLLELQENPLSLSVPEKLSYPLSISVSASLLSKTLRDLEHISASYVSFTASSDTLVLASVSSPGDELGHIRQESRFKACATDNTGTDSSSPAVFQGVYLLKYLTHFTVRDCVSRLDVCAPPDVYPTLFQRHLTLSDVVKVYLRPQFPLCLGGWIGLPHCFRFYQPLLSGRILGEQRRFPSFPHCTFEHPGELRRE